MEDNNFGQNRMGTCCERSQGKTQRAAVSKKKKNTNEDKNKKIFHAENTLLRSEKILCQKTR